MVVHLFSTRLFSVLVLIFGTTAAFLLFLPALFLVSLFTLLLLSEVLLLLLLLLLLFLAKPVLLLVLIFVLALLLPVLTIVRVAAICQKGVLLPKVTNRHSLMVEDISIGDTHPLFITPVPTTFRGGKAA